MHFELNEITRKLPSHLHQFIVPQPYEDYSEEDQEIWRYVMRLNVSKLKDMAHHSYLEGLRNTGIEIDRIPKMEGMNRILKNIGWAAVSVDGFIPPSSFMEFQAYNVLVIASDIRRLGHIGYTPAPDIIHEAAGHAPIIANPEYAEYLRRFGEIGAKAIASKYDQELYEAIRLLSILKEDKNADLEQVAKAEKDLAELQELNPEPSELAQIRNLHWWTVEYGLIGTLECPKIYGAGLLSSIEESTYCLSYEVDKIPYGIEAANQAFDITKPQPQLFVTPNFAHLSYVLEEFANTMALRRGGVIALERLQESNQIGTVELSTGLQISGILSKVICSGEKPSYMQFSGVTALAYRDKELIGHGCDYHKEGFGSPLGKLKDYNLAIEDMSPKDLEIYGIMEGEQVDLEFEGGVRVQGRIITGTRNLQGKIMLISFEQCTVSLGDQMLFLPEWGIYDMAIGKEVISGFSGPADPGGFDFSNQVSKHKSSSLKSTDSKLDELFARLRAQRAKTNSDEVNELLKEVLDYKDNHWLLLLTSIELAVAHDLTYNVLWGRVDQLPKEEQELVKQGIELFQHKSVS